MRLQVHSGCFQEEEGYVLTPSSRLLKDDNPIPNLSPLVLTLLQPTSVTPWHFFGNCLKGNDQSSTAFETAHGMRFWEHGRKNPEFCSLFNKALGSDSQMMGLVDVRELRTVFERLSSLVDVGGGNGVLARTISEKFLK